MDDDDSFPKKFKPAQQVGFKQSNDTDYVQQMIQANVSKTGLGFGGSSASGMQTLGQPADGIKTLVKSERKNRKKGKKAIKVQEFYQSNTPAEEEQ